MSSGWDDTWLAGYEARMQALRLPARNPEGHATPHGRGGEQDSTPAVIAPPAPSGVNSARGRSGDCAGDGGEPRRHSRPEEALQAAIVRTYRHLLVPGARLFATNGELPGGAEQVRRAGRRKAMGYMRGTPDLCARRPGFLGWIEAKAGYNKQTAEQVQWAEWAQRDCGDGYAVVNSVEDAGAVLRIWGMLRA